MKKAANILFLIGGIVAIVWAIGYLISGIVFLVMGSNEALIVQLINEGQVQLPQGVTAEEFAKIFCATMAGIGAGCLVCLACSVASSILSFKGRNSSSKAVFILNIVFGVLAFTLVPVVAAVFGLIKGDTIVEQKEEF
ncbi:MAG: hypothetical protein K5925_04270 [Bacilli bacterium]|nr:hypothetical protein [Bacilli bacterium]